MPRRQRSPNVVLIISDEQRADTMPGVRTAGRFHPALGMAGRARHAFPQCLLCDADLLASAGCAPVRPVSTHDGHGCQPP